MKKVHKRGSSAITQAIKMQKSARNPQVFVYSSMKLKLVLNHGLNWGEIIEYKIMDALTLMWSFSCSLCMCNFALSYYILSNNDCLFIVLTI